MRRFLYATYETHQTKQWDVSQIKLASMPKQQMLHFILKIAACVVRGSTKVAALSKQNKKKDQRAYLSTVLDTICKRIRKDEIGQTISEAHQCTKDNGKRQDGGGTKD